MKKAVERSFFPNAKEREKMNNLLERYITIEQDFFQELKGEIGEVSGKLVNFVRSLEVVRPARFIPSGMKWCGIGRKMLDREKVFRAFMLKAEYNLPTTKLLIENLKSNSSWRLLCGWEYSSRIPSEATFSRAFAEFAKSELPDAVHEAVIVENLHNELIGHGSMDSTAIAGREKPCRKNTPKKKIKKKRGRKSRAERETLKKAEETEIKTRRLALQPYRTLSENLADLPQGCDKSGKCNSKGDTDWWVGYKLHLDVSDGGIPLAAILTSASPHDSQVAIPLMQMASERVRCLYDVADSAYDAPEIKQVSKLLGHVPIIDPNKRRGEKIELEPASKKRFNVRSGVERANSEMKDNYGANQVRVKGHLKVFCHLMFGVIALTVKQIFNYFA
ncbi:MAG: transposase [Bacteroidia bacterium]|nr:transposase [Bacteroidia bacterium]